MGIAKRILVCPSARIAHVAGLDAVFGRAIGLQAALSPPRTFSDATVALGRTLIVCDAANDDAYCDFLEARCFPGVRFVFGVPLRDGGGAAFGALILFDYKQRQQPDPRDVKDIEQIAEVIALALQARSGEPADRTH
ncbi:MAG: GAF domain-containing protein [Pseudomonadota bacterium]